MNEPNPYASPPVPPPATWQAPIPPHWQALRDAEHLKLLAIFHYVLGAMTAVFSSLGLIHFGMGIAMLSGGFPPAGTSGGPPAALGWMFVVMGGGIVLLGWAFGCCMILTGRWLSARKNPGFCFTIACIECLWVPVGTALGVCSIMVLQRPTVVALFDANRTRRPPPAGNAPPA